MTCISDNAGALTRDLVRLQAHFHQGFCPLAAHWHVTCQAVSHRKVRCQLAPVSTARSKFVLSLLLLQTCRMSSGSWSRPFLLILFLLICLPCLWLPSRWASRSTTTQRRKDRLRQHSEHIGLDNDLREVGGVICGQQELVIWEVRFRQTMCYNLGQFCSCHKVCVGLCSHLDASCHRCCTTTKHMTVLKYLDYFGIREPVCHQENVLFADLDPSSELHTESGALVPAWEQLLSFGQAEGLWKREALE